MLVLSRKKHEAILIGGSIRLEVLSLAKAAVRLRLTAPRSLQPLRAPSRRVDRTEPVGSEGSPGEEVATITLLNQQVIALGESISLGVLDADRSRVLVFVDAPIGTAVSTREPEMRSGLRGADEQNLLQFMKPSEERPDVAASLSEEGTVSPHEPAPEGQAAPKVLPFPSAAGRAKG